MADVVYNNFMEELMKGTIDLSTDDIRVRLCMTNTTCDTEEEVATLSGFTTLDTCDGSGYADQALANEAVSIDATNDRAKFDADDTVFSSLGAGTRNTQGVLVYKFVTDDTDSIPLMWIDFANQVVHTGSDFTIAWNADGIGYMEQGA